MKSYLAILISALPLVTLTSFAEVEDLLIPVTGSEEASVRVNNEQLLKEYLSVAKRHRIVRVNADLLLSEEKIRIALFDGLSLIFEVTDLRMRPDSFNWTGMISEPPYTVEDLLNMAFFKTLEMAKMAHTAMFGISISADRYLRDDNTGGSWRAFHSDRNTLDTKVKPWDSSEGTTSFYAIRASFDHPILHAQYRLRSLESDPQYHILIEVDRDKLPKRIVM